MKRHFTTTLLLALACTTAAFAQDNGKLSVASDEGIAKDGYIDTDYAFCIPDAQGHAKEGHDKSIGIAWGAGPAGTKSYALVAVDPDVPATFDDANKPGKTLPADAARKDFYHWVLYDIPTDKRMIPANTDSDALVKHGKAVLKTPYGTRGVNSYAGYFAGNPDRKGVYAGYDGPCPPWNDERIHHYHFKVFALDVGTLGLKGEVTGDQVMRAIAPHILAQGEVVGKYSLNANAKRE